MRTTQPDAKERGSPRAPSFTGLRPASEAASRAKRANGKTDTRPELLLRRSLWRLGLRYRKHAARLPGKPDIVFRTARVLVFCDGDFWHGRNWDCLKPQLERRHNASYWVAKIQRNIERDRANTERLKADGWAVVRLWETDITRNPHAAALRVKRLLARRMER